MDDSLKWPIAAFGVVAAAVYFRKFIFRSPQNSEFKMRLLQKSGLTHNTAVFRFSVPRGFTLPVGQHVVISRSFEDKKISRAYTPIAIGSGWVDLLIKIYRPNERFPQGGLMSQYIDNLEISSEVDSKGPVGRMEYLGRGLFKYAGEEKVFKKVAMIAGGTGITPMYQVMQAAKDEEIEISLLFANQTPDDILLKEELEKMKSSKIKVALTVDKKPDTPWPGLVGFIDKAKIQATLPAPANDVVVLICGPPPMTALCKQLLGELGYQNVFG